LLFVAVEEDDCCRREDVLCPIFNQQDAGGECLGSWCGSRLLGVVGLLFPQILAAPAATEKSPVCSSACCRG
jgi:hypothetical protein